MHQITDLIKHYLPEVVAFRHDLHQNPEPGYMEFETSRKVAQRLKAKGGFRVETGIAGTGVVATLGADKTGRGIALRADMDCLPISEKTEKDWTSRNPDFMHACGHDGHTSCLLGTALALSDLSRSLQGPVKFIFQPAEEGGAGGEKMVKEGVLSNPQIDMVFGLHGWPGLKLGEISSCSGPMMANADEFEIKIHGKGGHAAFPQKCVDPIVIASQIVTALQTITSRNTAPEDSVVVTVGKIEGGTAFNIIPETVSLLGTVRTLSASNQDMAFERIKAIACKMAEAMGARSEVKLTRGYPVLENHPEAYNYWAKTLSPLRDQATQVGSLFPQLVGEDFAYFAKEKPACFFALGLRPENQENYPQLHQATFDFNDDALPIGMRLFAELVLKFWA